jgi:drug/metabolite transporter (DMT)-like permease
MTIWFILALSAPILWAFNIVMDTTVRRHFIKNDSVMMWLTAMLHMIGVIPFFIFVKVGFESIWAVFEMIMVGTLWTIPFLIYYRALESEESSRTALLLQMGPIWALLLAFIFLGESLSILQSIAFIILLIAGLLAAIRRIKGVFHFSKSFWFILSASFLWSFSDVIFKILEPKFDNFYSAFAFFFLGSAIPAFFMLSSSKLRKSIKKHVFKLPLRGWLIFLTGKILDILGSIFFAYALVIGSVALTSVLVGIEPLVVLIFSYLLGLIFHEVPKEDFTRQTLLLKGASFFLVLCGLLLLYI